MPDIRRQIFAYSGVLKPDPAVSVLPGKRAWQVRPDGSGGYTEQALAARLI